MTREDHADTIIDAVLAVDDKIQEIKDQKEGRRPAEEPLSSESSEELDLNDEKLFQHTEQPRRQPKDFRVQTIPSESTMSTADVLRMVSCRYCDCWLIWDNPTQVNVPWYVACHMLHACV